MALTVRDFEEAIPALKGRSPQQIEDALLRAAYGTSAALFGDDYERAVFLLAAHEITFGRLNYTAVPSNPDPRQKPSPGSNASTRESHYLVERRRLLERDIVTIVTV